MSAVVDLVTWPVLLAVVGGPIASAAYLIVRQTRPQFLEGRRDRER